MGSPESLKEVGGPMDDKEPSIPVVIDSVWPDYYSLDSKIREKIEHVSDEEELSPNEEILDYAL